MQSQKQCADRDRHSDPSTPYAARSQEKAPHRGSDRRRGHSLSPRKNNASQPLHIRMNLTETQMNRITDAFTSKVTRISEVARHRRQVAAENSKLQPQQEPPEFRQERVASRCDPWVSNRQGKLSADLDAMPGATENFVEESLAERRQREHPGQIQAADDCSTVRKPQRPSMEPISWALSPLSPILGEDAPKANGDQGPLSRGPRCAESSYLGFSKAGARDEAVDEEIADKYATWLQMTTPTEEVESSARAQKSAQKRLQVETASDGSERSISLLSPRGPEAMLQTAESPLFSPLALYFRGQGFPSKKMGEKTMIGDNGWLERTEKVSGQGRHKKTGVLESIKRIAKEMTAELPYGPRRYQTSAKESCCRLPISLDAREQSLLYCELEFHLGDALHDYITSELDRGHLLPGKLKKVSDGWQQQGRPRVIGFRYDLETQIELIGLHVNEFNFYGRRQSNPAEITGLLQAMKTNARAMRVRTFCQPDSVIAKQLVDAQSLFNLVNVSDARQVALAEIAGFFKLVVERERIQREEKARRIRATRITRGPVRDAGA